MVNSKNKETLSPPCLVGAVSNCADAMRLETASTGVIAQIFPALVGGEPPRFIFVRCGYEIDTVGGLMKS